MIPNQPTPSTLRHSPTSHLSPSRVSLTLYRAIPYHYAPLEKHLGQYYGLLEFHKVCLRTERTVNSTAHVDAEVGGVQVLHMVSISVTRNKSEQEQRNITVLVGVWEGQGLGGEGGGGSHYVGKRISGTRRYQLQQGRCLGIWRGWCVVTRGGAYILASEVLLLAPPQGVV